MRIEMAVPRPDPETIALQGLVFIMSDDSEISRFLGLSGISPEALRQSAGTPETLRAVMEYLMGHEPTARAFAENAGYKPDDLGYAAHRRGAI